MISHAFEGLRIGWNFLHDFLAGAAGISSVGEVNAVVNSASTVNTKTTSTHGKLNVWS